MQSSSSKGRWILLSLAFLATSILLLKGTGKIHATKTWTTQHVSRTVARLSRPIWKKNLYTPTFLTKIGSQYFIVDCWHNRVIYSRDLTTPIERWQTLDDDLAGPHSIASDSVLYVVDDTGRSSLRVYTHHGDDFQHVQTISGLGLRTHRIKYDEVTSAFYVVSSNIQQIAKLVREGDRLKLLYQKPLPFLHGQYTRSFTILDGYMYFNSGPHSITKTKYLDDSYDVVDTYPVSVAENSMNDLFRIGKYIYITASPTAIIRTTSLEALRQGKWENLYSTLGFKGTPYFIGEFDGRIYVPEITEYSGIKSFVERDGTISDITTLNDSGSPTWLGHQVWNALPK